MSCVDVLSIDSDLDMMSSRGDHAGYRLRVEVRVTAASHEEAVAEVERRLKVDLEQGP